MKRLIHRDFREKKSEKNESLVGPLLWILQNGTGGKEGEGRRERSFFAKMG